MKIACSCMMMVLLLAGCATTGKVDEMIDAKLNPQMQDVSAQFDAQTAARAQTLEDMKTFVSRLGKTLSEDVSDVESNVAGLKGELSAVKKDLAQVDLESVKAKVSELDSSVGSLNDSVDQLNVKASTLTQTVAALEKAEKERTEAEKAAAEAKAALPEKGLFHKHPAGVVE